MNAGRGFSLIELVIAMAIVAIVTAIALPAFQDSVRKSRRADAHSALMRVATNQEKWRANHTSYTSDLTNLGFGAAANADSTDGYYTISVTLGTNPGVSYTATASPKAGTAQANDTCTSTYLVINQDGPVLKDGNATIQAQKRACWGK